MGFRYTAMYLANKLYLTGGSQMVAIASIADGDSILLKPVRSPEYYQDRPVPAADEKVYSEAEANEIVSQAVREVRQEKRA